VPLTGREAAERFGLAKSGSIATAVDRLVRDGLLTADEEARSGLRVVDPFLGAWLRRDD
jgi:DNA-binding PadR family transcriptional regulator